MTERPTQVYALKNGKKVVQFGVTDQELEERLGQHISDGKIVTHICPIGGKMTRKNALEIEGEKIRIYQMQHGGKPPIYNKNKTY